jgi:hypothetical protein
VVRSINPGKAFLYCEKDQRTVFGQWEPTKSERSHLTQPTSDAKNLPCSFTARLIYKCFRPVWRAGNALVGRANFDLADAMDAKLQWHVSRVYVQSVLSSCPPACYAGWELFYMRNQALLASKFVPRPPIPVASLAAAAASLPQPCFYQTRYAVPPDLNKVLYRLMPWWTVAQGPYPSVTGTVRDINAANQLMADVEAVTGSKLVVARTRARSSTT